MLNQIYKFHYVDRHGNSEHRIALPLYFEKGFYVGRTLLFCWDFVRQDHRRFDVKNITNIEDVTDLCVIVDCNDSRYPNNDPVKWYENNKQFSVWEFEDKVYVVKLP